MDKGIKLGEWRRPTIRPLLRLGEQTWPTTISASSPDRHKQCIDELHGIPAVTGKK